MNKSQYFSKYVNATVPATGHFALGLLIIGLVAAGVLLAGCSSPGPSGSPTPAAGDQQNNSTGPIAGKILLAGSSSLGPHLDKGSNMSNAFARAYPDIQVDMSISDSGNGIQSTESGIANIGMSSRYLTPEDGADLKSTLIGYDGVAVIVSNDNPVSNLSRQQIKDIFAGNITSWKSLGGNDQPITVFQREPASGTRTAFNNLVMGTKSVTSKALQASNTMNMVESVSGNPNAIGYSSFCEMGPDVKALTVDGISPSPVTIKNKSYALQRPYLLITKGTPTNQAIIAYINFILSPEGQEILSGENIVRIG